MGTFRVVCKIKFKLVFLEEISNTVVEMFYGVFLVKQLILLG